MSVQVKFQICTISVSDILETCQFRPKKLKSIMPVSFVFVVCPIMPRGFNTH
ncbi:hypothetical protein HanPI659440_Chr03g0099921 [Helianthus annuus]|nr:hypothetical protein HanPI659440_Chr03g0099921 [Helianthus annuus]